MSTDVSRHHDHPEARSVSAVELCLQGGEGGLSQRDVTSPFGSHTGKRGPYVGQRDPVWDDHMEFKVFQGKDLSWRQIRC